MVHVRLAVAAILLAAASAVSQAQVRQKVDVRQQPMSEALRTLGQQMGLQVMFRVEDLERESTTSPAVSGELTPEEALGRMLQGTHLTYRFVNPGMVLVSTSKPSTGMAEPSGDGAMRLAQADTGSNVRPQNSPEQAGVAAAGVTDEGGRLEEILVTAQKRVERLKDVPISISVLSGEDLDRSSVVGVKDALNFVPGVVAVAANQGGGTQIGIRGVGANGPLANGSSPVAYYLDSVPFGLVQTAVAPDSNAYDLERVEVLRGPQGTLYGANAQNGVVRILTNDANPDAFELKARTSVSSTDGGGGNYRGDMAVNLPIVEGKLAARAVVGYENLSGWINSPVANHVNDAELRNYRLKVNAEPSENLSIGLSAWSSRADYGAPSSSADDGRISLTLPEPQSTDYDAYGLKIDYDFSAVSISSMTSYLDYSNTGLLDAGAFGLTATPFFTGLDSRVFAQETLLRSTQGQWRWTAGVFYRDAKDRLRQSIPGGLGVDWGDGSKSTAVFGELTHRFLDQKVEWTLGARYFHDEVRNEQHALDLGQADGPLYRAGETFDSTTPRAVLTWYPNEGLTVYGSYSEGFRSGFPQNANVARQYPEISPVKPDKLHNYELGAKADLLDRRLSLDTAVYYIKWNDVQQTLNVLNQQGIYVFAPVNGESASGLGVDFGLTAHPVDGLSLGLSFSWNDLQFDSQVFSAGVLLFDTGERVNFSSEFTGGASIDYTFPLGGSGFKGRLSASANYSSEQYCRFIGDGQVTATGDSPLTSRASASLIAPRRWTATAFVDNANNERGSYSPVAPIPDWYPRLRPLTVGIQVDFSFD